MRLSQFVIIRFGVRVAMGWVSFDISDDDDNSGSDTHHQRLYFIQCENSPPMVPWDRIILMFGIESQSQFGKINFWHYQFSM